MTQAAGFERMEHTADAGLRVWAPTQTGMWQQAMQGFYDLALNAPVAAGPGAEIYVFAVSGATPETRLVYFLQELVFLLETRRWVARELVFQTEDEAHWKVQGRFVTVPPSQMAREVKSPTYHQLQVRTSPDWRAEIFFDL